MPVRSVWKNCALDNPDRIRFASLANSRGAVSSRQTPEQEIRAPLTRSSSIRFAALATEFDGNEEEEEDDEDDDGETPADYILQYLKNGIAIN